MLIRIESMKRGLNLTDTPSFKFIKIWITKFEIEICERKYFHGILICITVILMLSSTFLFYSCPFDFFAFSFLLHFLCFVYVFVLISTPFPFFFQLLFCFILLFFFSMFLFLISLFPQRLHTRTL